jgi:L-fuconolactonase
MPDFPIVDSHVHLWDPARLRYDWLAGVPALNRPHGLADFRRACGAVAVAKFVFVQCECAPEHSFAEADWVSSLAAEDPRLRGIVAQAPLEQGDAVEPALARLATLPLVRGVRRLLQEEPDDAFCLRPDFVRGVRRLARHGLSFDVCVFHRQLANVVRLARQCPEVRFVLDHAGKPDIRAGRLDPWRADVRDLATLPNVWCKLSGLAMEADRERWRPADLRPYIDHVLACFGPDRVMFGGDWPVSAQAVAYGRWFDVVEEMLAGFTPDVRHRIFVRNAERFYQL